MALNTRFFCTIGGAARRKEAPMMFGYNTEDTAANVKVAGYFNDLWRKLFPGDTIAVSHVTKNADGEITAATAHTVLTVATVNADTGVVAVV